MNITPMANDEIKQIIEQHHSDSVHAYLLVDPRINDALLYDISIAYQSTHPVLDRQQRPEDSTHCLQLWYLDKERANVERVISLLNAPESAAIALLYSPFRVGQVVAHLSNAMYMRYQGAAYLFRYYDPKVLHSLLTTFSHYQLSQILGVIEYWYFYQEQFVQLHHKPQLILSDIDYQISSSQWQAMYQVQYYHAFCYRLEKECAISLSSPQRQQIKMMLHLARRLPESTEREDKLYQIARHLITAPAQLPTEWNCHSFEDFFNHHMASIANYLPPSSQAEVNHG